MPRLKPTINLLKVDRSIDDAATGIATSTPDADYAARQAAMWAQRHGMSLSDSLDVDLTSSGWLRSGASTAGVDVGAIDRHPNAAGASQPKGGSDFAAQPSAPRTTTPIPTTVADKALKKSDSGAQKCSACGSVWLTADTGVLKACRSCGSGSLIDPAASFAKSATRQSSSSCTCTNAPVIDLGKGSSMCGRCGAIKGTVPSNQSTCAPLSKSAQALSQSQSTALSKTASKSSDDRVRSLVATALYDAAKKTRNPVTRGKLEKLAQGIDSGSYPVPPELALRFDSVRLSTGLPSVGSGRSTWQERHGF